MYVSCQVRMTEIPKCPYLSPVRLNGKSYDVSRTPGSKQGLVFESHSMFKPPATTIISHYLTLVIINHFLYTTVVL